MSIAAQNSKSEGEMSPYGSWLCQLCLQVVLSEFFYFAQCDGTGMPLYDTRLLDS